MNLFVFDDSPWQSALWLDDVRKNKTPSFILGVILVGLTWISFLPLLSP